MIDALCGETKAPPLLVNFLRLLVDRNRLHHLEGIARVFGDMADARAGRVRAKVVSAFDLQDVAASRLSKSLERATGREVVLDRQVEKSLLGGAVANVGGKVYDGSLQTQLEELRRQLKSN
jgi:F-type H+-transporting ATPase subunit delta